MTSLAEAFIVGGAIGVFPLLLGFVPSFLMSKHRQSWYATSAGTALGFLCLFFTDLIEDSAELGVSLGLALRPSQLALAALFILGFAVLLAVSRIQAVSRGGAVRAGVSGRIWDRASCTW